jgi:outer membrane protein OmpA-like peptidoglycan-associated protein
METPMTIKRYTWLGFGISLAGAGFGCASSPPPQELVDARAAYQQAEASEAQRYSPAALHDAKVALNTAERAYMDDDDSSETRDIAYVAERKAQFAEVEGRTLDVQRKHEAAQANAAKAAQGELLQTREQLQTRDQQLKAERDARTQAEARAKDALTKLAAANAAAVKEEPRGTVITLQGNVLFASGKSELLPGAQAQLAQVADALKEQEDKSILVEGHTDSRGSEAFNMELSRRRAEAVGSLLVSRGLPAERVKTAGIGPARPIADNATAEGRANNRRVEVIIQSEEPR